MNIELIILFDYYGGLLTSKQQLYFEDYYFNNLSLQEIAENYNISRNAVYNSLKEIEKKLIHYESVLKLHEKSKKIESLIVDLDDDIQTKIKELIL